MKKIINNDYLILILRFVLGFFFIFAALGKIVDPLTFSKEIGNYQILPFFSLNILALFLPWIELISGFMLIFGINLKSNSIIIGGLLFVFIVAVLSAMMRGLNINCGCISNKIVIVGWGKILENTGLLIVSLILFFTESKRFSFRENYELKS
jgi:putative oxidoreductase